MKSLNFDHEVGLFRQKLALLGVLGPKQDFQWVVQVAFEEAAVCLEARRLPIKGLQASLYLAMIPEGTFGPANIGDLVRTLA